MGGIIFWMSEEPDFPMSGTSEKTRFDTSSEGRGVFSSAGDIKAVFSPIAIGYGLWWTVLFSNGLNGPSWLPLLQHDAALAQFVRILLYVVYAVMFVIALGFRGRLVPLASHGRLLALASIGSSAGLVLMGLAGFSLVPVELLYCGVVLFAVGTMLPILGFGERFATMSAKAACINVCISLVVASPLFFLVAWMGSQAFPIALTIEAACPLLAFCTLWVEPKGGDAKREENTDVSLSGMPRGLLVAMFVYGAAFGLVLGLGVQSSPPTFLGLVANAGFVCALSLGVLIAVCAFKTFEIGRVYRPILPLLAIGFIMLAVLGSSGTVVSMGVVLAGYACARIFSTAIYSDIVARTSASPFSTAAMGALADAAGVAVGSVAAFVLLVEPGLESQQAYNAAMVVVAALIVVTVFLLSESRIGTLWGAVPSGAEGEQAGADDLSDVAPALSESQMEHDCATAAEMFGLTPRETEVLRYLVRGKSAAEIAGALVVSKSTVLTHTKRIYAKLDVHSRVGLMNAVCFAGAKSARRGKRAEGDEGDRNE